MPEIWQLTREEFVGNFPVDDQEADGMDRAFASEIRSAADDWLPESMKRVPGRPGFYFADLSGRPQDVVLLMENEIDGSYEVVGGYIDEDLWVADYDGNDGSLRGRGLGAEMVIAKMQRAGAPFNVISYTTAGKAAHVSAHRIAVQRALQRGLPVPKRVLEDYPDLVQARHRAPGRVLTAAEVMAKLYGRTANDQVRTEETSPVRVLAIG